MERKRSQRQQRQRFDFFLLIAHEQHQEDMRKMIGYILCLLHTRTINSEGMCGFHQYDH
jgi:hypothetical protein